MMSASIRIFASISMLVGDCAGQNLIPLSVPSAHLPEGVPENKIIEQLSEGLIDGFSVGGFAMKIALSVRADVDIPLDLHRCLGANEPFSKQIVSSMRKTIARFPANEIQHGLQSSSSEAGSPQWTEELMVVLVQLLQSWCGLDSQTEEMLTESIETLGQVKMNMESPKGKATLEEISDRMAHAVQYWTKLEFKKFGDELGVMLRELVLMVYPLKYSLGQDGHLQRKWSWTHSFNRWAPGVSPGVIIFSLLGFVVSVFIGLVVVRRLLTPKLLLLEVDAELGCAKLA